DPVEDAYYRDRRVPEEDRMEWIVELEGLAAPVRVRIGAGRPPAGAPPGVEARCLSAPGLGPRVTAALSLPASLPGRARLAAGRRTRLSSVLWSHARAYRTEWRGELRLAR